MSAMQCMSDLESLGVEGLGCARSRPPFTEQRKPTGGPNYQIGHAAIFVTVVNRAPASANAYTYALFATDFLSWFLTEALNKVTVALGGKCHATRDLV